MREKKERTDYIWEQDKRRKKKRKMRVKKVKMKVKMDKFLGISLRRFFHIIFLRIRLIFDKLGDNAKKKSLKIIKSSSNSNKTASLSVKNIVVESFYCVTSSLYTKSSLCLPGRLSSFHLVINLIILIPLYLLTLIIVTAFVLVFYVCVCL